MRGLGPFLKDAWRLARPYFSSEEKWSARGLLLAIIVLNLSLVGMSVVLSFWNREFYNSLQNKDWEAFIALLFWYRTHRERLHARLLRGRGRLHPGRGLSHLSEPVAADPLAALADRHDCSTSGWPIAPITASASRPTGRDRHRQPRPADRRGSARISWTARSRSASACCRNRLAVQLRRHPLGPLRARLTLFGVTIPGYMVWVALIYAAIGTTLTHLGRPPAGRR